LLDDKGFELNAQFAHFDYEKAAAKSFREVFPTVDIKVCSFHAKQALLRWAKSNGLTPAINQKNDVVMQLIQMLGSLQHVQSVCYPTLNEMISGWLTARFDGDDDEAADELRGKGRKALFKMIDYYL